MAFRINESYAKKYNEWRQREEKQKLKAKYGDVASDDDDEDSSSSEDEDAEELTPKMEKGWLKALAALKSRDPSIYDPQKKFYESSAEDSSSDDEEAAGNRKKSQKEKAMFLKDYEREVIVEKEGKYEDEDEDEDDVDSKAKMKIVPGYYEEQEEIKKGFKDLLGDSDSDAEDLFVEKEKSKEEKAAEEQDYLQWLKGKEAASMDEQSKAEIKPLKEYWSNPNISASEAYLRDFILNKRYIENDDDDDDDVPGFDAHRGNDGEEDLDEEEEILQKQETFEHKYNFRFEEPDAEFIKSYPRTIGDSLRQKDTRRKEKRKAQKERKALEKAKKKEEIKQLKNIKKKEIVAKLEQLKEATGNKELAFKEAEIEEEFDPSKHDQMMQHAFDEDYYDDMGDDDDEKPVFSDMDDEEYDEEEHGEGGEEWKEEEPHCEDPDFNMDADYDPNAQPSTSYSRKKEKKRFKEAISKEKPVFDPAEKTFEEYLDEYYKLDFEDVIGDLPCRFKYRAVLPNDFGLSTEEILAAKPNELNKWVSVKKMSMYRTEEEEQYDRRKFQAMAQKGVKYKVIPSLTEEEKESGETSGAATSQKGKKTKKGGNVKNPAKQSNPTAPPANSSNKKRKHQEDEQQGKKKDNESARTQSEMPSKKQKTQETSKDSPSKKRKDKKKWIKSKQDSSYSIPEDRFKAYGMDPKNYKAKHANK